MRDTATLLREAEKARVYMEEIQVIDLASPPPPSSWQKVKRAYLQAKHERLIR